MARFKRIFHKLLFPGLAVVLICIPIAAALLIYTFCFGSETSPVAYVSYVFSAYATTILCAFGIKHGHSVKNTLNAAIHGNPFAHRYLTDVSFKMHISLNISLGLNLLYAVMKLFYGIGYRSVWFITLAVYYGMLALMRFLLLHHANRSTFGQDLVSELKQYRLCGVILMLMNIALSGVVILVVSQNQGFEYAGYLIYAMALYAFCNITTAVMDVIKYHKYKSPVMSAAKTIKLAAALVSMLSLETAMLAQFGAGEDPAFRRIMTGATGGCVCLIVLGMAVCMIYFSTKELILIFNKKLSFEELKFFI
ncbi:MAG: hypothetical protein ACI4PH_11530 [Faecousia sp.]